MAGTRACCYIAVDGFGAEVLGHTESLLVGGGRADLLSRCRFFWAGNGERPDFESYWSNAVPRWTLDQADDEPFHARSDFAGSGTGRGDGIRGQEALLTHVREHVASGEGLRWLCDEYLPSEFGRAELDEIIIILVGSLANNGSYALIRGFLEGSAQYRANPLSLEPLEYAILGIGHDTVDGEHEKGARARAGKALLGLQEYFESSDPLRSATAVCIVNEQVEPGEGVVLDRRSQVETGSAVMMVIAEDAGLTPEEGETRPLRFKKFPLLSTVSWGSPDVQYDPQRSFAYCTSSSIHYRASVLSRVLASGYLSSVCRLFASSDKDENDTQGCDTEVSSAVVDQAVSDIATTTASKLAQMDLAPEICPAPWSFDGAESIVTHTFDRVWSESNKIFGRELFQILPLEDWEQTLDDMALFVSNGLASRLEQDKQALNRIMLESLDLGFERAFSKISETSWSEEIAFAPRRHCRAAVSILQKECESSLSECRQNWQLRGNLDESEVLFLKKNISSRRSDIVRIMGHIPSPQALYLRSAGILGSLIALSMSIPFDLGVIDTWFARLSLGVVAAILVIGRSYLGITNAKRDLMKALDAWVLSQRTYIEARQQDERYTGIQSLLLELKRYVDWLLDSDVASVPDFVIADDRPWRRGAVPPDFPARRRKFLANFSSAMTAAGDKWDALRKELQSLLRSAKCVSYIPPLGRDGFDFGSLVTPPPLVYRTMPSMKNIREELSVLLQTVNTERDMCWLFSSSENVEAMWFQDALIPDGPSLLNEAVRERSPAFQLLNHVAKHLRATWRPSLLNVVEEQLKRDLASGIVPAIITFMNKSMGAIGFNDRRYRVSLAISAGDPLSSEMQSDQTIEVSPEFHCCLSVSYPLSAREVIFLDETETIPRTFLAQATVAALDQEK